MDYTKDYIASSSRRKKHSDIPVKPKEPRFKTQGEFDAFWNDVAKSAACKNCAGATSGATPKPNDVSEEAYSKLMDVMTNKPSNTEVLRRTLDYCREPRETTDVERAIQTYPEFPLVMQPPYRIITFLIKGGGLIEYDLDARGNEITSDRKARLNADQIDDLVNTTMVKTTDIGKVVADEYAPMLRLKTLLLTYPDRVDLYAKLLEYCQEPRTYADIEAFVSKDDIEGLRTYNHEPGIMMKPSVFIDNLECACGLVWKDHSWNTTDEGKAILQSL